MAGKIIDFPQISNKISNKDMWDLVNKEAEAFDQFTRDESDRGAVIVSAAMIDSLLTDVLKAALIPTTGKIDDLLDDYRPLSSASTKAAMVYRLGLISKEFYEALKQLFTIRNRFAHDAKPGIDPYEINADRIDRFLKLFEGHDQISFGHLEKPIKEFVGETKWRTSAMYLALSLLSSCLVVLSRVVGTIRSEPMELHLTVPDDD